jgi:hypothetical protein
MSLFIFKSPEFTMFILIYVDDITITCSKASTIDDLLVPIRYDFSIKDLGKLNFFFLGIEKVCTLGVPLLSQQRYILSILRCTNMVAAKPVASPMSTATSLSALEGASFKDPTLYRSTVGALQYLRIIQPDISFTCQQIVSIYAHTYSASLAIC